MSGSLSFCSSASSSICFDSTSKEPPERLDLGRASVQTIPLFLNIDGSHNQILQHSHGTGPPVRLHRLKLANRLAGWPEEGAGMSVGTQSVARGPRCLACRKAADAHLE
jgi:hypothetical protein